MKTKRFIWCAFFILLLMGCKSKDLMSSAALATETTTSLTNIPISLTSTVMFAPTPIPTLTLVPSPTSTISAASSITPHPTHTPIPTVTPANRIAIDNNRFGINATYPHSFESANELGIDWVRFRFDSRQIEPQMNQFEWEYYDTIVAKAREENLQILGVLGYTSIWNSTINPINGEGVNPFVGEYYPPFNYEIWGNSVYQIVSHYKDDVHYWEVWDKPDTGIGSTNSGLWHGSPQEYAQLLATAYNAIKRADPNAKVLLGSLSNPLHSGTKANSNPTFLDEILTDETYPAANYFDIIGIHFYDYPENFSARINEITTTLAATNTSDHPIWITEISYPSDGYKVDREQYFCNIISTDMVASNSSVEKFFLFDRYQLFITPGKCHAYG
ncbi:hypothetical protein MNBD_CHLOROFLEXI01-2758 [hydrothermal vent metagenome]|uniref:Asl1-like glycosyl hydrolase catalytic domain-containing protein n=1 Tax=hydrothermal vent metagenome TaxID=652676 RepID=A0A3B0W2C2_9ZZZZ